MSVLGKCSNKITSFRLANRDDLKSFKTSVLVINCYNHTFAHT